jgi:hypothetical protein
MVLFRQVAVDLKAELGGETVEERTALPCHGIPSYKPVQYGACQRGLNCPHYMTRVVEITLGNRIPFFILGCSHPHRLAVHLQVSSEDGGGLLPSGQECWICSPDYMTWLVFIGRSMGLRSWDDDLFIFDNSSFPSNWILDYEISQFV